MSLQISEKEAERLTNRATGQTGPEMAKKRQRTDCGRAPRSHDEYDFVLSAKQHLEARGYIVSRAGQRNAKQGGQDAGHPDFIVRRELWPQGMWLAFEAKTAKGRLSPAQWAIYAAGGTFVVKTIEEVLSIADAANRSILTALGVKFTS